MDIEKCGYIECGYKWISLYITKQPFSVCDSVAQVQGFQVLLQNGSDWPQMRRIGEFFRSYFSTFRLKETNCTEIWCENLPVLSHLGPIWPTFGPNFPSLSGTDFWLYTKIGTWHSWNSKHLDWALIVTHTVGGFHNIYRI